MAVVTEWHKSFHGLAGIFETFHVFLGGGRPTFSELGTLGLGAEVVSDLIFAINFALEVDIGKLQGSFFLLESRHVSVTFSQCHLQDTRLTRAMRKILNSAARN